MLLINRLRLGLFILCVFFAGMVIAQNPVSQFQPVQSSPKGNYILLLVNDTSLASMRAQKYSILRSDKGQNKFSEINTFSTVKSWPEFIKVVGEKVAEDFKRHLKMKSNEEVISFIQKNNNLTEYGLFTYNVDFLRALGFSYLDPVSPDKTLNYEYRVVDAGGKTQFQHSPNSFNKNLLPKIQVSNIVTTDSLVNIGWEMPPYQTSFPLMAKVYRQNGGSGKYMEYPDKLIFTTEGKKMFLFFEEEMTPEVLINYYVTLVDFFGNEGNPSDTASAITIDFKKVAGVQNIRVTDTLDGLLSQWAPLPSKPYYTGIQVLRSRDVRQDYIVLDSIAATSTSYLDKQVLPGTSYYYKFRVLLYQLSGAQEIPATAAQGTKSGSSNQPLIPKNLSASNEAGNIRLNWDHNMELDIFGYYVLRGTSSNSLEIVSPVIKDTSWVDSTANLSGRINYVYSVLAMNNNQVRSDVANTVGIRPDRGGFIQAPSGISARTEGSNVVLTWPDVQKNNAAIAGYVIYRKKSTEKEFAPLKIEIINRPYFEDSEIENNIEYSYRVSAIDRFGYESTQSPEATVKFSERIAAPSTIFVRNISTGVEVSWPNNTNEKILSYTIYRKVVGDKNFVKLGSAKPADGLFTDKKFIPNKLNIYTVSINYQGGESDKSVEKAINPGK